uniref:DUF4780 domain-containing protein n=1 Tax=Cacopsylla melanoneura TaxID=428564 RepID=A0A8D8Z2S2_9HEMI
MSSKDSVYEDTNDETLIEIKYPIGNTSTKPNTAESLVCDQELRVVASKLNRMHLAPKLSCAQRRKLKRQKKIAAGTWTLEKPSKQFDSHARGEPAGTNVLQNKTGDQTSSSSIAGERKRPAEHSPPRTSTESKKTKFSHSESLVTKMAIYLEGYPNIKLSDEDAYNLQMKVLEHLDPTGVDNGPQFYSCRIECGAFVVTCANQPTQKWLIDCVKKIGKWKELTLQVTLASKLLKPSTNVITKIPLVMKDDPMEIILQRIESQNIDLDIKTKDWRILNINLEPNGKTVVFSVPDEILEKLKERRFGLFLGFEKIQFSVVDKKSAGKWLGST